MSYCPATTNITILSLYNVCLQSNKLLLNSLHSLEICSTYGCAKHYFEMLSAQIFRTQGTRVGADRQTPALAGGVTSGKSYGLNVGAAIS